MAVGPRGDQALITVAALPFNRYSPALFFEARWRPLPGLLVTPGLRCESYVYTGSRRPRALCSRGLPLALGSRRTLALKAERACTRRARAMPTRRRSSGTLRSCPSVRLQLTAGAGVAAGAGPLHFARGLLQVARRHDCEHDRAGLLHLSSTTPAWAASSASRCSSARSSPSGSSAGSPTRSRAATASTGRATRSPLRLRPDPQPHHRRQLLSLPRGFQAGLRLRVISGNPDTPVLGARYLAATDSYLPIYGLTNSTRLPLFHQLDLRVDKLWTFDQVDPGPFLDVLNVYNHRSVEGPNTATISRNRATSRACRSSPASG